MVDKNSPTYTRRSKTGKIAVVRKGKRRKNKYLEVAKANRAITGGLAVGSIPLLAESWRGLNNPGKPGLLIKGTKSAIAVSSLPVVGAIAGYGIYKVRKGKKINSQRSDRL